MQILNKTYLITDKKKIGNSSLQNKQNGLGKH